MTSFSHSHRYYVRTAPENREKIEMSFNLSNYQPQLKGCDRNIYQTIYLNAAEDKELWTMNELKPEKTLLTKWWHQFVRIRCFFFPLSLSPLSISLLSLLSLSLPLPLPLSGGPFLSLCDPPTYLRMHAHNILFSDCRCRGVSLICTKTKGRNQTIACGQTKTKDSNAKTGKGTAPSHRLLFYYARHERRSRLWQHGTIL